MDHPRYASAPWCDLPTKDACNKRYAQWKRDTKAEYDARQEARKHTEDSKATAAFERYLASEYKRVEEILRSRGDSTAVVDL